MSIPTIAKDGADLPVGVKVEKQAPERPMADRYSGGEVALREYSRKDLSRLDLDPRQRKRPDGV